MGYCRWDATSNENKSYHDNEWGVPLHDDRGQFEFITLEAMQCGLSWGLIIKKREIMRKCFENFDPDKVAAYNESDIARIMDTEGMIRSRRKIEAVINNARAFKRVQDEFGSFSDYIWGFCGGKTILYSKHDEGYIPASNGLSEKLSRDLKQRGFKFVGPVVIYSHLQACGIINDHDKDCPCRKRLIAQYPTVQKSRYLEKDVRYFG